MEENELIRRVTVGPTIFGVSLLFGENDLPLNMCLECWQPEIALRQF